jgi:hypothetical protein
VIQSDRERIVYFKDIDPSCLDPGLHTCADLVEEGSKTAQVRLKYLLPVFAKHGAHGATAGAHDNAFGGEPAAGHALYKFMLSGARLSVHSTVCGKSLLSCDR